MSKSVDKALDVAGCAVFWSVLGAFLVGLLVIAALVMIDVIRWLA